MIENIEKMDELFEETRPVEKVSADDALALLGTTIRKASDDATDRDQAEAIMQRSFLLATSIEKWADSEDAEEVSVPIDLITAIRKDAEGEDATTMSLSEAMVLVGKKLSDEETVEEPVAKAADNVVWGPDLGDESNDAVDWGPDPEGVKA
jgi:hypothetical protein